MRGKPTDPKRIATFLQRLSEFPNVTRASRAAGISKRAMYDLRVADEGLRAAWDEAYRIGVAAVEDIAWDRAKDKSDLLLIFMLKAASPEKYRERHETTLVGRDGAPLVPSVTVMLEAGSQQMAIPAPPPRPAAKERVA